MSQLMPQWIFYAIASGGCAALNGVFAKLTTTQLTTAWATFISERLLGMAEPSRTVELGIRGLFFALNLAFNGVMWGLFTRALTLATSTVRVSVINTSANFVLTALLGLFVFREELSGQWWLGASLLVAGSVIIGRRDEGAEVEGAGTESKGDGTKSKGAEAVGKKGSGRKEEIKRDGGGVTDGASTKGFEVEQNTPRTRARARAEQK